MSPHTDTPGASAPGDNASTIARHGQLGRKGVVRGILTLLASALAVVLVSSLAVAGVVVLSLTNEIQPGVELEGEDQVPDIGAIEGGVNLLLVGSDSGEGNPAYGKRGENLNDVTMLLHIAQDHSNATIVSFPRDLFVPIPSCPREDGNGRYNAMSSQKINVTLSYGGLACSVLTVEALTGLDIPFAAKIEFDGVIQMSNAVGGVVVCVAEDIDDHQIGFKLSKGEHELSGWNALQFLRTRHGVGDGSDVARNDNQRVFLSALARTVKSAETLTDPVKVYGLAKAALSNMQMSNSLQNVNTLASIALALKDIPLENILMVQYPGYYGDSGSQSGVVALKADAAKLFDAIKADKPLIITGTTGDGAVVDPNAPDPSTSADPSTSPTTPSNSVELPSSVKGQSAMTKTCSAGR